MITLKRRVKDGTWFGQCTRYAWYLGSGIKMWYKPHPDYGPCNGQDMVNYLIRHKGFVKCGKENGAIFSYRAGAYGHTGMVVDAKKNIVNDCNWNYSQKVSTHYLNLNAVGAVYCKPKPAAPAKKAPVKKSNETIAKEVIAGKWGNGADRKNRLQKAGYNYNAVQYIVNRLVRR